MGVPRRSSHTLWTTRVQKATITMRMNRRNVLAGIGALTAGGGAVFGSGAFSQVEADRSMSVGVANDSSAYLQLQSNSTIASESGGDGNELKIDAANLNADATTRFDVVFDITHSTSTSSDRYIAIETDTSGVSGLENLSVYATPGANSGVENEVDLTAKYITVESGAVLTVGIETTIGTASGSLGDALMTVHAVDDTSDFDNGAHGTVGSGDGSGETVTS